jgi:hypothetical protein
VPLLPLQDLHAVTSPDLLHTLGLGPAVYVADIVLAVVGAYGGATAAAAISTVEDRASATGPYDDGVLRVASVKKLSTVSKLMSGERCRVLFPLAVALTSDVVHDPRTLTHLRALVLATAALCALAAMRTSSPFVIAHAKGAARAVIRGLRQFDAAVDTRRKMKPHTMQHALHAWARNGCPSNNDTQTFEGANRFLITRPMDRSSNHRNAVRDIADNAATATFMTGVMAGMRGVGSHAGLASAPARNFEMRARLKGRRRSRITAAIAAAWVPYVAAHAAAVGSPADGAAAPPAADIELRDSAVDAYGELRFSDGAVACVLRPDDLVLLNPIGVSVGTTPAAIVIAFASIRPHHDDGLPMLPAAYADGAGIGGDDAQPAPDLRKVVLLRWLREVPGDAAPGRIAGTALVERTVRAEAQLVCLSSIERPYPYQPSWLAGPGPLRKRDAVHLWDAPHVFVPQGMPTADPAPSAAAPWAWSRPGAQQKKNAAKRARRRGPGSESETDELSESESDAADFESEGPGRRGGGGGRGAGAGGGGRGAGAGGGRDRHHRDESDSDWELGDSSYYY